MSGRRPHPVLGVRRSGAVLVALTSVVGLAMFVWPLLYTPAPGTAHVSDAPLVFVLVLPLLSAIVVAELSSGGFDARTVALLGVLAGVGAALRPLGAGTAGIETVFFPLILAGRVFGPAFGFVLGSTTLFASALLTAGVGPWLPFQMLAASWVGMGAGLLPRRLRGPAEVGLLAAYGAVAALAYGFLMNLWFWPFALGAEGPLAFVPGDAVLANLRRFFWFSVATSTLGWDLGRAVTTAVAVVVFGPLVLATLRRVRRRAAFDAPVEVAVDEPPGERVAGEEAALGATRSAGPRSPG